MLTALPIELLERTSELSCTDGGITGCSLSLTSKYTQAVFRYARFFSVQLRFARSPQQSIASLTDLTARMNLETNVSSLYMLLDAYGSGSLRYYKITNASLLSFNRLTCCFIQSSSSFPFLHFGCYIDYFLKESSRPRSSPRNTAPRVPTASTSTSSSYTSL